ncbi:wax ester synthase/diacylglycerol acyltransferase 6-like [Wolffia australiana]
MDGEWGSEQTMSPGSRLFHRENFNCHIVAALGVGKKIDVELVKAGLQRTLVRHPRFSSVKVEGKGKPRWVKTKVALEDHLIEVKIDESEIKSPDQFVEDYVSELSRTSIDDFSKPLWELHLINLPTSDAEAVAVFRIHHSLGDGASLISLLLACTRQAADENAPPTLPSSGRIRRNHRANGDRESPWIIAAVLSLWAGLVLAWNTAVDLLLFVAAAAFLKDDDTPIKGKPGTGRNPKRIIRRRVNLEDVKAVKKVLGATVNDVLLGLVSATIAQYVHKRYKEEGYGGKKTMPKNLRIRSAVLVNIRPSPGIHDLAEMMEKGEGDVKWGNCLGCVVIPFCVSQREDPLDYVRAAKKMADRKKFSLEAFFTFVCGSCILKVFGIRAASVLPHRVFSHTTVSMSNVIGPVEEIAFCGHPIVYLAPTVYGHPHALTIHFQSYLDKLEIVIAADESVIPRPHQICDIMSDLLERMKSAAADTVKNQKDGKVCDAV